MTDAVQKQPVGLAQPGRLKPLEDLFEAARTESPNLLERLLAQLPNLAQSQAVPRAAATPGTTLLGAAGGTAVWGDEFLFALRSSVPPTISIDGGEPVPMRRAAGSQYWFRLERLAVGCTHRFTYLIDGFEVGASDVAGYHPDSYDRPGISRGVLSERRTVRSSIYPSAETDYWIYVNAGADAGGGAPVMVWNDGASCVGAADLVNHRLQIVSDNLVHQGKIPPMVHVLVQPSRGGEALPLRFPGDRQAGAMRSLQYDTVSGRYGRHLLEEVLPHVEAQHELRRDGYSRAVAGGSSGGLCAFTLGWFYPDQFARVHSTIGSFTGLQWRPDQAAPGGNLYADLVRREPKRNIRVWMSDGSNDLEVDSGDNSALFEAGSWPLQNIAMANALKLRAYDFHFRFGDCHHSVAQAALDLPESLAWLWREYHPGRATETFEQEPSERVRPIFRVAVANRESW